MSKKYEWGYVARYTHGDKAGQVYEREGGLTKKQAREAVEAENKWEDEKYPPWSKDARLHCRYTLRRRRIAKWEDVV